MSSFAALTPQVQNVAWKAPARTHLPASTQFIDRGAHMPLSCCPESKPVRGKVVGCKQYRIRCLSCGHETGWHTNVERAWRSWWNLWRYAIAKAEGR